MASDRLKWIRGEQERRRTERGRQRSEMMEQRKQGAQTQYLQRQANKAEWKGQKGGVFDDNTVEGRRYAVRQMPEQATNAIAMGETQRQYVTAKDQLDTSASKRGLVDAQAYGARRTADATYLGVEQRPGLVGQEVQGRLDLQKQTGQDALALETQRGATQANLADTQRTHDIEMADRALAEKQWLLEQQQGQPQYVPGLGFVKPGEEGGFDVTSELELQEAGLSEKERQERAYQRARKQAYAEGNWFQDIGTAFAGPSRSDFVK